MTLQTPVIFCIFNRPDVTQRVFDAIAAVQPQTLLVVADGARHSAEIDKCSATRAIIDQIDWPCDLHTNYADSNLGCGRRISSGLDWAFSIVEEAIVLEDDTLPDPTFFDYCADLLARYRHDERIMMIGGNSFQLGQRRTGDSYHFSKYCGNWGWATWRRAWQHYDFTLASWPAFEAADMLRQVCPDPYEYRFWHNVFSGMVARPTELDTWDHQWQFACWSQGGLAIEPAVNLVANLGIGHPDASHTTSHAHTLASLVHKQPLHAIRHPAFVLRHHEADQFLFDHVIGGAQMRRENRPIGKLKKRLKPLKKRMQALTRM